MTDDDLVVKCWEAFDDLDRGHLSNEAMIDTSEDEVMHVSSLNC